jgi:hypothetical protein
MSNDKDFFFPEDKDEVRILEPDFSLKKMIGEDVDLKQLFSTDNINKAQGVIETHKDNFLEWVKNDLTTLEGHYNAALADVAACEGEIKKLAKIAFVMKSQAGTFGYGLATAIAKSLDDFCNRDFKPTADHLTVIRKHIDTLQAIFSKNITGDGGNVGTELMGTLQKLVAKYQAKK